MKVRARKKVDATFNMSSMTDIVFLLLIFFIVLSTFVSPPGVVVDLPKATTTNVPTPAAVTVSINADGLFFIDQQQFEYNALLAELQNKSADKANTTIKLAASGKVPLEVGVSLFADIKHLGYTKVIIATQPKKNQ